MLVLGGWGGWERGGGGGWGGWERGGGGGWETFRDWYVTGLDLIVRQAGMGVVRTGFVLEG